MLRIHDVLLHTVSIGLLLAGITVINTDVARHVGRFAAGNPAGELAALVTPTNQYARVTLDAFNTFRSENDYLFGFAVVAVVLVVSVFRS